MYYSRHSRTFLRKPAFLTSAFDMSDSFSSLDNRPLHSKLGFSTLQDARAVLCELVECNQRFHPHGWTKFKDEDVIADLIPLRDTLLPKLVKWLSIFTRLDCEASKLEICAPSNLLMHYGAPSYCYQPTSHPSKSHSTITTVVLKHRP